MTIPLGESRAISNQSGMPELVIENPDIVAAEFKRASEFIVTAKRIGVTDLYTYNKMRRKTTYILEVTR